VKILSKDKVEPLAVTAVSIIARAAHLLFFLVIGNKYGASSSTDFVIYMLAPLTVLSGVVSGAAETVVMPVFHKTDNPEAARYIFLYSIKKIIIFTLPISFIIVAILSAAFQKYDFLTIATLLFIPLLSGLSSLKTGVLNASGRFRAAVSGPFFGALSAVTFLFFAPVNIYCFSLSFFIFELGKFLFLFLFDDIATGKIPKKNESDDRIITWGIRNAKWQLLGSFVFSLGYPVDIWFASTLDSGSVTFVEYANKLWNIVPLFFVGHITVIYAAFSKASIQGSTSINIHRAAIRYLFFGAAGSLFVFFASDCIIRMLYGFGEMNVQHQEKLSDLLKNYLIGAGPYVGGLVYVRAMSAAGRSDLLFAVACFGSLCNVIFDALFIRVVGLNGIGLATSLIYIINFFIFSCCHENIKKTSFVCRHLYSFNKESSSS
jgi:putative peptidoglycan lipid II flippase